MDKILLKNYGGMIVEVVDNLKKAVTIIKYGDHGDEFLVVKTEDGIYEYGWYLNRIGYPEYENLTRYSESYVGENKIFISAPELYYKLDYYSQAANKIFHYTEDLYTWGKKRYDWIPTYHNYDYLRDPQSVFDSYIDDVKEVYDGKSVFGDTYYGHTYHIQEYNISKIESFLKDNGIFNSDNIAKLNSLKKYWRIGEIDGKAGMRKTCNTICGDNIIYVIHNRKKVDIENLKVKRYSEEEYGLGDFERFCLDIDTI